MTHIKHLIGLYLSYIKLALITMGLTMLCALATAGIDSGIRLIQIPILLVLGAIAFYFVHLRSAYPRPLDIPDKTWKFFYQLIVRGFYRIELQMLPLPKLLVPHVARVQLRIKIESVRADLEVLYLPLFF